MKEKTNEDSGHQWSSDKESYYQAIFKPLSKLLTQVAMS